MSIQQIPFWKQNEDRRARQQQMSDQLDTLSQLSDSMLSAGATQANSLANLVGQAALKRIQDDAAAKSAKAAAESAQSDADDQALQALKDRMNDYATVDITV